MSTLPRQAKVSSNWKEEVNQRIAAHKNRKSSAAPEQDAAATEHHSSNNRAAAAAARVAARFAKAPSYTQVLENEARAAVRAAEAASRAALQAQAAAESMLAELQAANATQPRWQFSEDESPAESRFQGDPIDDQPSEFLASPASSEQIDLDRLIESGSHHVCLEADVPVLETEHAAHSERVETPQWHEQKQIGHHERIEVVEAAQPILANLIQFPREIVATRKARPRRIEGTFSEQENDIQLSIFEVEPESISIDPITLPNTDPSVAPDWMNPEWSGMQLDEHPVAALNYVSPADSFPEPVAEYGLYRGIVSAPFSLRLMAALVDGSLVVGAFVLLTWEILGRMHNLPGLRTAEISAVVGLLIMSALYLVGFFALEMGTPGMRYARIELCTFDGELPTRRARLERLVALVLSVMPVGVGVLWCIFDEDNLSWHDRLSGTYLRAY